MLGSRLLTKILADFLFGFYLLTFVLNHATNHTQTRCLQLFIKVQILNMKNFYLLFLISTLLISCKNNELKQKNDQLKQKIEELENQLSNNQFDEIRQGISELEKSETKFVWNVIYCTTGTYSYTPGTGEEKYENLKKTLYFSEIEEIQNFDETMKYKLLDKLENAARKRYGQTLHSIQERESFIFDSYAKASEFKYKTVN